MNSTITKDFNGLPIVFREDGYINMTKAIKHFPGKQLVHFWSNAETDVYLVHLAEALNLTHRDSDAFTQSDVRGAQDVLVDAKMGRNGGTFCHPKLAVFFARWLDVRFAVWCDLMIDNILKGNIQTSVVVPTEEALKVQEVAERLKLEVLQLQKENQELKEKVAQETIPDLYMTAFDYLRDLKDWDFARAYSSKFGSWCSHVARDMRSIIYAGRTVEGKGGAANKDTRHYSPVVLDKAWERMLADEFKPTAHGFVMPSPK